MQQVARSGKNIILCSDGTGNQTNKNRGTNVFKLFEAVDVSGHHEDPDLTRQIVFYDDGVGTNSFAPLRLLSGAFGFGLARNVRQLYRALCRSYEPGDRIYLFGFSRGAFTVRTLAGLITDCGIVDVKNPAAIPGLKWIEPGSARWLRWVAWRAWRAHRRHYRALLGRLLLFFLKDGEAVSKAFRSRYAIEKNDNNKRARVHFIGVWDTVAAVGLPFDAVTWAINKYFFRFSFPTTKLSPRVEKACHALAIDDERHSFHPLLWDEAGASESQPCQCSALPSADQGPTVEEQQPRIEQVWFAGMHSNVGGGYAKQGLSLVALDWMMAKAEQHGLRFSAGARDIARGQRNAFDHLYNSRAGLAIYYRYKPRDIAAICEQNHTAVNVHASVFDRVAAGAEDYLPGTLPAHTTVVSTPGEKRLDLGELEKRVAAGQPIATPGAVWTRSLAHTVLLLVTLLVVWFAVQSSGGLCELACELWHGRGSLLGTLYERILQPILDDHRLSGLIFSSLFVVWLASTLAKGHIQSSRATFWRHVFRA